MTVPASKSVNKPCPKKRTRARLGTSLVLGTALLLSACSSGSTGATRQTTGRSIRVGLLTDLTGLGASANGSSLQGVEAGVLYAKSQRVEVTYEVADTQTSTSGALSAAQKLVEQDHVAVVIAISGLTFAAASYLHAQGIPVIGVAQDASEWITDSNMFSVIGAIHTTAVTTAIGDFFEREGVSVVGSLGYIIEPSSAQAANGTGDSARNAGLRVGYINSSFPLGSTNVQPIALSMKAAGVNGLTADVEPNTSLALVSALRQLGDFPKVALLADGYGGDLAQGGAGVFDAAQGVYFSLGFEPVEMHTTATEQFAGYLSDVGVKGDPTSAEYYGYLSVGLLVQALESVGPAPTDAALIISALQTIHDWNALGLLDGHTIDIAARNDPSTGQDNCTWITKLIGDHFEPVAQADPLCGTVIPGMTAAS